MRRTVGCLMEYALEEVAAYQGMSVSAVKKLVRPYKLLKYIWDLKVWNQPERDKLEDEKLKSNPYTRLFTLKETQRALRVSFDKDQNVISALDPTVFRNQMIQLARDFLLPEPTTQKPKWRHAHRYGGVLQSFSELSRE
ncbi:MAG: hypothetical protein WDN30_07645 [Pararobbsia sp.]